MKEVRTYTCIAVAEDDSVLYCGTTTGDVMMTSTEGEPRILAPNSFVVLH